MRPCERANTQRTSSNRRRWAATLAMVLIAAAGICAAQDGTPPADRGGVNKTPLANFITRQGDKLMDGDQEFRFIGANMPGLVLPYDWTLYLPERLHSAHAVGAGGRLQDARPDEPPRRAALEPAHPRAQRQTGRRRHDLALRARPRPVQRGVVQDRRPPLRAGQQLRRARDLRLHRRGGRLPGRHRHLRRPSRQEAAGVLHRPAGQGGLQGHAPLRAHPHQHRHRRALQGRQGDARLAVRQRDAQRPAGVAGGDGRLHQEPRPEPPRGRDAPHVRASRM